jgi:hypothetical protein
MSRVWASAAPFTPPLFKWRPRVSLSPEARIVSAAKEQTMSCWADWFPISPAEAKAFTAASRRGDDTVQKLLGPWLERLKDLPAHVEMDKAWEPIHRCLTGNRSGDLYFAAGKLPLKLCVLGGRQLLHNGYRTASLVDADKVPGVATALVKLDKAWLRERFFALPGTQSYKINDEMFRRTWAHFQMLLPFFEKVASEGNAVICTISH